MDFKQLPDNLPVPKDDGAADHLVSMQLPNLSLPTTKDELVNIGKLPGVVVFYIYPMTGRPDTPLPDGWDAIPGARGCTPQSCSFKDHYLELQTLQTQVFGLSTQQSDYQLEAKQRLHLPFELLSDAKLGLKASLDLPMFETAGMELYKRMTLVARDGFIIKVFYPVFPPGDNAAQVLAWLRSNA